MLLFTYLFIYFKSSVSPLNIGDNNSLILPYNDVICVRLHTGYGFYQDIYVCVTLAIIKLGKAGVHSEPEKEDFSKIHNSF